jgi:hypothetical protein
MPHTRRFSPGIISLKEDSWPLSNACYVSRMTNPWNTPSTPVHSSTLSGTKEPSPFENLTALRTPLELLLPLGETLASIALFLIKSGNSSQDSYYGRSGGSVIEESSRMCPNL